MTGLDSLYALAERERIPLKTSIELLPGCNLECGHCFVTHDKPSRLSLPVLTRLLDELQGAGGMYVTLTGGEIGLREDLFEIVAEARRRFFSVQLLTNGTLWEARQWDRVRDLAVGSVRMTLYATDPAVHDRLTGVAGSHANTMATCLGLLERGVRVGFACTTTKGNADQAGAVLALAKKLGVDASFDPRITWTDQGDPRPGGSVADAEQLARMHQEPEVIQALAQPASRNPHRDDEPPCTVGQYSSFVQCTGDVLPCANWPHSAGNIFEKPFLDIWHHSEELERARSISNSSLTTCQSCRLRPGCHPCPGMNLQETGEIEVPSPTVCAVASAHHQSRDEPGSRA